MYQIFEREGTGLYKKQGPIPPQAALLKTATTHSHREISSLIYTSHQMFTFNTQADSYCISQSNPLKKLLKTIHQLRIYIIRPSLFQNMLRFLQLPKSGTTSNALASQSKTLQINHNMSSCTALPLYQEVHHHRQQHEELLELLKGCEL